VQQNNFRLSKTYHEFEVIRLWEMPPEIFLQYQGLLPFAVLANTNEPQMILSQVAQAIDRIVDRNVKSNLTAASAILANLVVSENIIKGILRSDIMQESAIYQEIFHSGELRGELRGELKGELKGKLKGKQEEKERVALSLLRQGIGFEVIANATELPLETIEILQRIVNQNN
ncbi:Rpn family recombination-promoting nuclease/putative transposase, partial [Geminocystis sp. CENA526]|uniref:Rpn family recombination-promoting nuclease/putative transposase n=1 Tax=Geminocystis sp. CENA526 TaxID=1355871 RepID=UPI003D6F087F